MVPALSFFNFCEVLLDKYKDDQRINMICLMNHLKTFDKPKSDYFFSRGVSSIWGFAIWKRDYDQFYEFHFTKDDYIFDTLIQNTHKFKFFQKCYMVIEEIKDSMKTLLDQSSFLV